MINWLIIISVGAGAFLLTGQLRRYALARDLVDIPNRRSSHSVPSPRGGASVRSPTSEIGGQRSEVSKAASSSESEADKGEAIEKKPVFICVYPFPN